jgi:hypothetical protein
MLFADGNQGFRAEVSSHPDNRRPETTVYIPLSS